jgi:hypothetical protein
MPFNAEITGPRGMAGRGTGSEPAAAVRNRGAGEKNGPGEAFAPSCLRQSGTGWEKVSEKSSGLFDKPDSDRYIKGISVYCIRRFFASGHSPAGKMFGGCISRASLKSFCIGIFAHLPKNHPSESIELPLRKKKSISFPPEKGAD